MENAVISDMVERVARAIAADERDEQFWPEYVSAARAAIAAMREPTPEMMRSGMGDGARGSIADALDYNNDSDDVLQRAFTAMIDTALSSSEARDPKADLNRIAPSEGGLGLLTGCATPASAE